MPRGDPAKTAADKWVDIVVDDAAQYLRHHVKLVQEWQTKEGERVEELKSFPESKMGAAFLEARSKFFPEGIPRNRKLRLALFSNPELCSWRKPKTVFVGGATEAAFMEGNPELVLLRDTNTTYRRLSKPFTRPTWTPISTENLRWPFIPTALFDQRQGLSPTKDGFSVCIPVPPTSSNTPASVLRIPLNRTTRLTRRPQGGGPWELEWKDEIAGEIFPVAVKGMRFEHHGGKWTARMTYERQGTPLPSHEQEVIDATYKKISPPLVDGDVLVTFSLEPRTKRDRSGAKRVGWLRVVGMKEGVAKELFATPVDSSQNRSGKRAIRRGKVPFHRNSSPRNSSVRPSAHGPTDGVSFPQIVHLKGEIDREVRFIRAVKDLSQKEETVQWILKMRRNVGSDTRGIAHGERLRKIQDSVERGSPPSNALMGPFRERLKGLREKFAGMKRAYRHGVAKDVLRQVHRIREMTESENRRGIGAFRREYPSGSVFLVIENHKGRGAGPLRQRVTNRALGSLGAAEIYGLIEEKAAFMNRPIPVLAIPPKGIRKDCPSCDHTHAKGQSGPTFSCGGCGHKEFVTSVATKNLVRLVLAPRKKVKEEGEFR